MTGAPRAGGGVVVTYTYTYGCKNTMTLTMTPGNDSAPGQVTSNECSYVTSWAGIGPPPPPAVPFRCIDNKCHATTPGLPGLDNKTCALTCGPLSGCLPALFKLCKGATKSPADCEFCAGTHKAALAAAGCKMADFKSFCGGR